MPLLRKISSAAFTASNNLVIDIHSIGWRPAGCHDDWNSPFVFIQAAVVGQSDSAASALSLVSYSQSSSHTMVTTVDVLSGYFRPCVEYFWLFAKP